MNKLVYITILLAAALCGVQGVSMREAGCEELFKASCQKMKELYGTGFSSMEMIYSVRVTSEDNQTKTQRIEIKVRDKKLAMLSEDVSIYQDEKDVVAIHPEAKMILITHSASSQKQMEQFKQIFTMQDSIFKHMHVQSCKNGERKLGALKEIILYPDASYREKLGVQSVTYWLEESTLTMKRARINFSGTAYPIKSMEYWIDKLNMSVKEAPFEGKAESMVLTSKTLKTKYQGYRLIDNRKK